MKERIQKIIAQSGIASRRKSEALILEGRVAVNGTVVRALGTCADPDTDAITVDDTPVTVAGRHLYIMLHKPHGFISSLNDPEGRPIVQDLLNGIDERLYPVGRLDYDTEGLLVMTNDGSFSHILQHPSSNIPRTYIVKVGAVPSSSTTAALRRGIALEGKKTSPAKVRVIKRSKKNTWIEMVIFEGRNRQIKKMMEQVGHPALRIIRTEFGPLSLGNLPAGTYRFLTRKEIAGVFQHAAVHGH